MFWIEDQLIKDGLSFLIRFCTADFFLKMTALRLGMDNVQLLGSVGCLMMLLS